MRTKKDQNKTKQMKKKKTRVCTVVSALTTLGMTKHNYDTEETKIHPLAFIWQQFPLAVQIKLAVSCS